MATDSTLGGRRQTITAAIATELKRQGLAEASRLDVNALARAIHEALDAQPPVIEGKRPEDLNATNDD